MKCDIKFLDLTITVECYAIQFISKYVLFIG